MSEVTHVIHIDMPDYTRAKAERFIGAAGLVVEERAVLKAAVDRGEMRQSISSKHEGLSSEVTASAPHAPYVEYGTGPHMIDAPVNIRGVGWRYIKMHPGTPPQPFMRPAVDEVRTMLRQIWNSV